MDQMGKKETCAKINMFFLQFYKCLYKCKVLRAEKQKMVKRPSSDQSSENEFDLSCLCCFQNWRFIQTSKRTISIILYLDILECLFL